MSGKAIRLVVIGSVNLDFVATADHLPSPGETVGGATLARHPGGKGANQALAARRLGADVALHAVVGRDALADEALALLRADGVDLFCCKVDDNLSTGVALIAVSRDGENQIVVAPGANAAFDQTRLDVGRADGLLCQLEIPVDTVTASVLQFGGFAAINLAPAARISQELLDRANLLVVNESEAAFYGDTLHGTHGLVAITYGAQGAALFHGGKELARVESPRVNVVDTTGAGDAFCAGLTLALMEGAPHVRALAFACAAGALAATRAGAQSSLPLRAEVDALCARTFTWSE